MLVQAVFLGEGRCTVEIEKLLGVHEDGFAAVEANTCRSLEELVLRLLVELDEDAGGGLSICIDTSGREEMSEQVELQVVQRRISEMPGTNLDNRCSVIW